MMYGQKNTHTRFEYKTVVKAIEVKEEIPIVARTFNLYDISEDDALALVLIMRAVGGDPAGPRGVAERVLSALYAAGFKSDEANWKKFTTSGNVYIKKVEDK